MNIHQSLNDKFHQHSLPIRVFEYIKRKDLNCVPENVITFKQLNLKY
jgi:hypothetical protein